MRNHREGIFSKEGDCDAFSRSKSSMWWVQVFRLSLDQHSKSPDPSGLRFVSLRLKTNTVSLSMIQVKDSAAQEENNTPRPKDLI